MLFHESINGQSFEIDTYKDYSGSTNPEQEERLIRKFIGLPITKQLVYYKNIRDPQSVVNIKTYKVGRIYRITDLWCDIEILTEDGIKKNIHSAFLAEMQKPSFVADMIAQQGKE